ncbi:MAG TPA: hypothetical protein P5084_13830, partial [Paludibacter sp.]|nr:hypothetical protein [Paludibacter sp.]
FYYTKKREQIDQDDFLSGYMKDNDVLLSNSFKKTGLVYEQSKLKKINNGDILVFNIESIDDCDTFSVCFKKNDTEWEIFEDSTLSIQSKPNAKQIEKYLINHVERLEAFEERLFVTIQNISFKVYIFDDFSDYITVYCEVHAANGTTLKTNLQIEFIAYSKTGSILDVGVYPLNVDKFFGFEICNKDLRIENLEEVGKIRIYPHS